MKFKENISDYNKMSIEEQVWFFNKCSEDPVFFIENCVMVPRTGGDELVTLYKPQREIVEDFMVHHNIIMNKSRQTGGSFIVQSLCAWLVLFQKNYVIGVVSRSGSESSKFNKKILDILDKIPQDFIRPKPTDFMERNAQSFKLGSTMSEVISQAVSPMNPEGILRGNTLALLIIDECAFINNIETAFTAIMPATSQAHRAAEQNGVPHGTFIISTPNGMKGRGEYYYKLWIDAKLGKNMFRPKCIHWKDIPGLDDEWYQRQCKILNNDPKRIKQEMEMQFISSDGSFWSEEIQTFLTELINNEHADDHIKEIPFIEGGTLYIHDPNFNRDDFCILGIDVASGSGSDNSTIEVINYKTCKQIAEFIGKMEPLTFADKVVKKIALMYPNNLIVIENSGGYGLTVLNSLQADEQDYNIFGENKINGIGKEKKLKHIPGLNTNSKTRPLIIEAVYNHVKENKELIESKRLAAELLSLVNKNGKVQADDGYHDDLVMAIAFCLYVRKYAPEAISDAIYNPLSSSSPYEQLSSGSGEVQDLINSVAGSLMPGINKYERYGITNNEYTNILKRYDSNSFNKNKQQPNDTYTEMSFLSILDNFNASEININDNFQEKYDDIHDLGFFTQDLY